MGNKSIHIYIIALFIGVTIIYSDSIVIWDTIFKGARHITPLLYSLIMTFYFLLLHKNIIKKNLSILDMTVLLFMGSLLMSVALSYINGTSLSSISNYSRFWLHGGLVYFLISRIRIPELYIKKLFRYLLIYSFLVSIGYIYVYIFGNEGFNIGHLFLKSYGQGGVRIIGDTTYIALVLFFIVTCKIYRKKFNYLLYCGIPSIFFSIAIHKTRSFILGLLITLVIWGLIEYRKIFNRSVRLIFIVSAFLFVAYFLSSSFNELLYDLFIRMTSMYNGLGDIATYQSRLIENKWALEIYLKNNLLLGVGLGSNVFLQTISTTAAVHSEMWGP